MKKASSGGSSWDKLAWRIQDQHPALEWLGASLRTFLLFLNVIQDGDGSGIECAG